MLILRYFFVYKFTTKFFLDDVANFQILYFFKIVYPSSKNTYVQFYNLYIYIYIYIYSFVDRINKKGLIFSQSL